MKDEMNTINKLMHQDVRKLLDRFYDGNDSIIRNFCVSFRSSGRPTQAQITISVRDQEATENAGWVNLILELSDVTEFMCHEGMQGSYQVVSGGLHILTFDNTFYIDFGYFWDDPTSLEEFRQSKFYLATTVLSWQVTPYQESV